MDCTICDQRESVLKIKSAIEIRSHKYGKIELTGICEVCMSKLIDFLKSLGWAI